MTTTAQTAPSVIAAAEQILGWTPRRPAPADSLFDDFRQCVVDELSGMHRDDADEAIAALARKVGAWLDGDAADEVREAVEQAEQDERADAAFDSEGR